MTAHSPLLSVIVRLGDDPREAARVFDALSRSDLARPRWELIVVALGPSPAAIELAVQHADMIVRLERPWTSSSAYVCNRGAEVARAPVLVFLEGRVLVRPDTLSRMAAVFAEKKLAALVAGIDPAPHTADVLTRCATLLHDSAHRRCLGDSEHFTTCASAIRRTVFFAAGGLDEWPIAPEASAGTDLGLRLHALGHRVELRDDVRVAHNGRVGWKEAAQPCPLQQLPPPWLRVRGNRPSTETRRFREREQRLSIWVWLATAGIVIGSSARSAKAAVAAVLVGAAVILVDASVGLRMARNSGLAVAALAVLLRLSALLTQGARAFANSVRAYVVGEPRPEPGIEALGEVGVPRWPPAPARPHPVIIREPADALRPPR